MVEQIIMVALFTLGYCCTFWEGMIFERVGDFMECNLPDWLWKPLGGCYICACMWVGSAVYWAMWLNDTAYYLRGALIDKAIVNWFITCVGAMGLNAAISFISRIADNKGHNNSQNFEITINND